MNSDTSDSAGGSDAEAFQERILATVSRTFALTIPQLPPALRSVVANAYLLCRIVDTIEDEPALSAAQKIFYQEWFLAVLEGEGGAEPFAREVVSHLSVATLPDERKLILNSSLVVFLTHRLPPSQQQVLVKCVRIMCRGMGHYLNNASLSGLADMREVDRYCYHVAGVVGEMLTELFCQYSDEMRERRTEMLALAPSFGEGLQLTNILKDIWDDRQRGICWLPQEEFRQFGVELISLVPGRRDRAFAEALRYMVGITHAHLADAFRYITLVPSHETGIRRFCLWAVALALLTVRRIHDHPSFTAGGQVKVSRRVVKSTMIGATLTARHDRILKLLFDGLARGLPLGVIARSDSHLSPWVVEPTGSKDSWAENRGSIVFLGMVKGEPLSPDNRHE
jgi:farnesyl-diphosphate farnesyltransferase